jgi:hypothetical protein
VFAFFFLSADVLLGLDVDTVKELADILLLDEASLVDLRSSLGDLLDAGALEHELVLGDLDVRAVHLDGGVDVLSAHQLLAEEVADLDGLALYVDVDGEVGRCEAQLVAEALRHARDHVAHQRERGVDGGHVGAAAEPTDSGECLSLRVDAEVKVEVVQILRQLAAGALHGDLAALARDRDFVRDRDAL